MQDEPYNLEAEEALLGALLVDPDQITLIETKVKSEDFYLNCNRILYQAMLSLHGKGTPPDFITIEEELGSKKLESCGGITYLFKLNNAVPNSQHATHYATIVTNLSNKRKLVKLAAKIVREAHEPEAEIQAIIAEAERALDGVSRGDGAGFKAISEPVELYNRRVEYTIEHPNAIRGLRTGLIALDRILGGLEKKAMITIAGRPGMGKSALALTILRKNAKAGKKCAIATLEMSEEELINRLVAMESGIDSRRLWSGKITKDEDSNEWASYFQAVDLCHKLPLYIGDFSSLTASQLKAYARQLDAEVDGGLDLLVVDYLQLMSGDRKSTNRQEEISVISRSIKQLAKELDIPIIALSQLSREIERRSGPQFQPRLSDLRESGSIEQDSDVVIFINREEVYDPGTLQKNVADIAVGKNRSGPLGKCSVFYRETTTEFTNLATHVHTLNPEENTNGSSSRYKQTV